MTAIAAPGPAAFARLFSPGRIGRLELPNRLIMAAMETNMADAAGNVTGDLQAYYLERARGGVGMVTVEFTCVDRREGVGAITQLSLDSDATLESHRRLAAGIRAAGARACVQLHHSGRQTVPRYIEGRTPIGPSEFASPMYKVGPRPMREDEIAGMIESFATAAARAVAAGYQAIELHGAHGYLLGAFLSPWTNRREDRWGGDFQRRLAFPCAVIAAVRRAAPDLALIYRLSAVEGVSGGLEIADTVRAAPYLVAAGADALHVSTGVMERLDLNVDPIVSPEGWRLPLARRIAEAVAVPVIGVGVIRQPQMAEAALAAGDCHFIALARALLADPQWPDKARTGAVAEIRPCTSCNWCIDRLARQRPVGCAENPRVGREAQPLPGSAAGRRTVVVGGGPGGLAAAIMLRDCGAAVTLFESRHELGGGLLSSANPPGKDKIFRYRDWLLHQLGKGGIELQLGCAAEPVAIAALAPDLVLLAHGPRIAPVDIPGAGLGHVRHAYDLVRDGGPFGPGPIVVYGGGETGCETAEMAAAQGFAVTIVSRSPLRQLARAAEGVYRRTLIERLRANPQIRLIGETSLCRIDPRQVELCDAGGERHQLPAGQVILAQGRILDDSLAKALQARALRVETIGDARAIRRIGEAVEDAYLAVCRFTGGATG